MWPDPRDDDKTPVMPLVVGEVEVAVVELDGRPTRVITTPPPPLRRGGPESSEVSTPRRTPRRTPRQVAPRYAPAPPADGFPSLVPAAREPVEVQHDLARLPAFAAVVACVALLVGFAVALILG